MYYTFKAEKERLTIFIISILIILMKLSGFEDDYLFYFLIFMILFVASRYIQIKGRILGKLIKTIDKYSYHIFLVHPIVLYLLRDFNWFIEIIFGVIGSFALAWIGYRWIDRKSA